eukprot:CAMPEP_0113533052 /NCGR_PEP_ID=MMETSP0015_2-20120614/4390_1 /TAXON_ID=2838 /ORGANISM="Odontella" /LENGTH=597 /DNA_ID=CAMNT_0000432061 /DNA_START=168 /DNA_END=1961 /DNA_ORIENTATION=- /assembly_acc=CAM_ASM_000160
MSSKSSPSASASASASGSASIASEWGGWRAALGCAPRSLAYYRISLGVMLFVELALRFQYLHAFYSDEGTFPTRLLRPQIDSLYSTICVLHCRSGALSYQRALLSIQCAAALCLAAGYRTRCAAIVSWALYLSLTLRNTWLAFILDRYFHYLLFYAMFLPWSSSGGGVWSLDRWLERRRRRRGGDSANDDDDDDDGDDDDIVVSPATIALKLQIAWIYLDAGYGKYSDPLGGWTFSAHPLPALDTYARHTVGARCLYALLGPYGLRLLTPTVVWVELGAAPLSLMGSYLGRGKTVWTCVMTAWMLHLGIAGTVRNTILLSLVANVAWCIYLPPPLLASAPGRASPKKGAPRNGAPSSGDDAGLSHRKNLPSLVAISAFVAGSVWFEVFSAQCDQSMKHIWSTLLHNRWNVFVGAEEYVTWEIAPGRLSDGSVVDVWSKNPSGAEWDMPGAGAPSTSTARAGRWRSFPYLADFASARGREEEGYEEGFALWDYLCKEWDGENGVVPATVGSANTGSGSGSGSGNGNGNVNGNEGRRLLRYNFFMLQADVLPEMGFSKTRKRLIRSHECGGDDAADVDVVASAADDATPAAGREGGGEL